MFVGSSGCGKTTLLRMVNRMIEPTSGRILIDGDDIARRNKVELRRSIGYVLQAAGLLPHRKVVDNVATVPVLNGVPKSQARSAALDLLDKVGLDRALADRYPRQLSGGQQQRVGVARALASDPNILLMDEPFGAVDPIVRADLQAELNRLQRELGKTIVFVTHDIDEAFLLADQVVIFRKGGVIAQAGTPAEILAAPADDFVASFIGADKGKRTLRLQQRDGATVRPWWSTRDGRPIGVLGDEAAAWIVNWTRNNLDLIGELTWNHVQLAIIPIALSFVLSIPLGWVANRNQFLRSVVITGGSLLYTIPSLPLFLILPLVIGTRVLDSTNLVVALTIYGVAIMARSATDALASVDASTVDASMAMGYSTTARFFRVELPLAGPVLLAGIRVVSVSTIALVSVGVLIGSENLGSAVPERQAARHPRRGRRRHRDQPADRPDLRRGDRARSAEC